MDIEKPVVGNFCWVEANLEDTAKGKGFYGELFGWSAEDMPMPSGAYTMFKIGDKQVAGMLHLPEAAKKNGAPSHWLSYVAVDDVPAGTKKAEGLGGKVLLPPTPVGPGTMSVIQDPTGGVFALWAARESMGTMLFGHDNSLCWNELSSTHLDRAKDFYSKLFGWKLETLPMGEHSYTMIKNGEHSDRGIGGMMQQPASMAGSPCLWTVYFAVANCDATAQKASKLGGQLLVPPTDIPTVGRFSVIADNQGASFAIIQNFPEHRQ